MKYYLLICIFLINLVMLPLTESSINCSMFSLMQKLTHPLKFTGDQNESTKLLISCSFVNIGLQSIHDTIGIRGSLIVKFLNNS